MPDSVPSTPGTPGAPAVAPTDRAPHPPGTAGGTLADAAGHEDPCALPVLAEFCACHERFEHVLQVLRGLPRHLQRQGPDEQARTDAAGVLNCLDTEGPAHRALEEREVLPLLRHLGGPAGAVLAGRLEAEHGLLARAWSQCRPALAELAASGRWSAESAVFEYERWRDFVALATAHMLAEQGAAFPIVAAALKGMPPP
ncbi:MAG: hemerythrin domain-containing protein [Rubrivivax sp.]|nr:hemerythrin domain-containing protein [Rubrivivax sp.]